MNDVPQQIERRAPPLSTYVYQNTDDIDLGEVLLKLAKQWKLMAAIIVCGSLLSVIIAFALTPIYRVDTTVSMPSAADVSPFLLNGYEVGSAHDVFARFYNTIRSQERLTQYVMDNDYLPRLFPNITVQGSDVKLAGEVAGKLLVDIDEPLPEEKGGLVEFPERLTLSIELVNEEAAVELLTDFIEHEASALINRISQEQKVLITGKIDKLKSGINTSRVGVKEERLAEIARISATNAEKIDERNKKIATFLLKAAEDTADRIVQIKEARTVAQNLGIIYPTELKELRHNDSESNESRTLIKVNDNDSLPMFLMGTRYLDSLLESIGKRKNDAAFVGEINELKKEIRLIEQDPRLLALKSRTSDDPYIPSMPSIQATIAELNALSLDFSAARIFSLEKNAFVNGKPIKPRRALIILVGFLLSGIIAVMLGGGAVLVGKKI